MKNLKNTLVALGLAAVLGVGAATANAEISNKDSVFSNTKGQYSIENDSVLEQFAGIIMGLFMTDGLTPSDAPSNTEEENSTDGFRRG